MSARRHQTHFLTTGVFLLTLMGSLRFLAAVFDAPALDRLGLASAVAPLPHPINRVPRAPTHFDLEVQVERTRGEVVTFPVQRPDRIHRATIPWIRVFAQCWTSGGGKRRLCDQMTQEAFCRGALLPEGASAGATAARVLRMKQDGTRRLVREVRCTDGR